jgi:hypothetical protein
MNQRTLVSTLVMTALFSATALADPPKEGGKKAAGKEPDPQAMMAEYEKLSQPVEQHKMLQKMVGKWTVAMKSWMAPNQPPMESTGTAEVKSLFGDRYIQMSFNATFMGKPFSGLATTGYDRGKKKFVGTWIDSMSTGMMRSEGTADASGKVITSQGVAVDPMTGKESRTRMVEKWESDDKVVEEFFEKRGGKEAKTMEITYTRAK